MGAITRLLLLDMDFRGSSVVEERGDVVRLFGPIPDTAEVITGSGSRHAYFRYGGGKVPKEIAKGVQLKGDGGYAVVPPSIHPNGNQYIFDGTEGAKAILHVADVPGWLTAAIANAKLNEVPEEAADTGWPDGQRNTRLASLAGKLRRNGLSVEAMTAALLEENRLRCRPPLEEAEVRKIAKSIGRYRPGVSRDDPAEATLELLNACEILVGRIQFAQVTKRDSMIIATTVKGREVIWPTTSQLANFNTSRGLIGDATGVFLPTPRQSQIRTQWEPVARLLLTLATADEIRMEPVLREETRELVQLMWRRSGESEAKTIEHFIALMREIADSRRDPRNRYYDPHTGQWVTPDPPPSVFLAEGSTWVHLPTMRTWLSVPSFVNKLYPLAELRNGAAFTRLQIPRERHQK
jgi:hypothetical protein